MNAMCGFCDIETFCLQYLSTMVYWSCLNLSKIGATGDVACRGADAEDEFLAVLNARLLWVRFVERNRNDVVSCSPQALEHLYFA